MAIPTAVNYPTSLDDATTLFGDPVNQIELTLATGIDADDTSMVVSEDISSVNVPTFLAFETGEIVYAAAMNSLSKTFSSLTRGDIPAPHNAGEKVSLIMVGQYISQLKKAIIAIETILAINPNGASASVSARIKAIEDQKAAASGLASLNSSSKVVQEPASKATANGIASLNASSKVVQDPENATATPTASKIPIADGSGKLDGWVTQSKAVAAQLFLSAAGATPATTSGCANPNTNEMSTNKQTIKTADFDASTEEYADFVVLMPSDWDGGTLTAKFAWMHAATTTNFGVVWGIKARSYADDEALDQAFGTAVTVSDTGGTTNDLYVTSATGAMTIGGTPAAGGLVVFRVYRKAADASDTMTIDAKLIGVQLTYTRS
jgi:hypothetical protein